MLLRIVFLWKRLVLADMTVTSSTLFLQMKRHLLIAATSWLHDVVLLEDGF